MEQSFLMTIFFKPAFLNMIIDVNHINVFILHRIFIITLYPECLKNKRGDSRPLIGHPLMDLWWYIKIAKYFINMMSMNGKTPHAFL